MAITVFMRTLFAYGWFLLNLLVVLASPIPHSFNSSNPRSDLYVRGRSGVIINDAGNGVAVFNSQTQQLIPQGSASDGGGSGYNVVAVLWIVLSFLLGGPLSVAGIRGWRLTIGAATGLSTAVCGMYCRHY
jgi:hypothetical protein